MTYSVVGEKSKQEPAWKGPLDIVRIETDLSFLALFCIFMSVWLLVSIYAFVAGDVVGVHQSGRGHKIETITVFEDILESSYNERYFIFGFISLTGLMLAGYITMFRWATKMLVISSMIAMGAFVVLDLFISVLILYLDPINPWIIVQTIVINLIFGLISYAFNEFGTEMVCKVVKESCKAMFFFPSTLMFALWQCILQVTIFLFAVMVYRFLSSIQLPATDYIAENITIYDNNGNLVPEKVRDEAPGPGYTPIYVYVMQVINVLCWYWAHRFFEGLARSILTAAFATWYHHTDDKEAKVPKGIFPKCFTAIASHHAGTIAYAASPLSIFVMLDVVWKYERDTMKKMFKRPVLFVSWLTVLYKFSFDALALNALHGTNFYDSAKNSYILLMKNPKSYLVINTVSECVIFAGLLLIPILTFILSICYVMEFERGIGFHHGMAVLVIGGISVVMAFTCFMVFRAATNTLRFCYLEDSKFKNEAEMKLYEIHVDDISIKDANVC